MEEAYIPTRDCQGMRDGGEEWALIEMRCWFAYEPSSGFAFPGMKATANWPARLIAAQGTNRNQIESAVRSCQKYVLVNQGCQHYQKSKYLGDEPPVLK